MLTKEGSEHRSLNWILTHNKFVKPSGSQYDVSDDYYGFFPINRPEYVVKDFTVFSNRELDSISSELDFVYYTDAYGIYTNEWVYGRDINERSRLVYGGLSNQGYDLFRSMYQKRNLAISEFNNIASPTSLDLRFKMSRILEIDFTGWTGRFFHSLDTLQNPDIPRWMKRLHLRYFGRPFDYPDISGIVLIHESERIMVLQNGVDLDHDIPIIETPDSIQKAYGLPEFVRFPYWFDVTFALDSSDIYAQYNIHTNKSGDSILASHGLTNIFPAIIGDSDENLRYYFCGDWCDNPVPFGLSYFKGSEFLRKFFYNNRDQLDRKKFFWEYYIPLITTIMDNHLEVKDSLDPAIRPLPPTYPNYVPYYRKNNIPLPDIEAIASGRRYDPEEVLGTQYIEAAFRDSMRRAIEEEAARTGYFIGEYGDTIYIDEPKEETDTARVEVDTISRQVEDSLYRESMRDYSDTSTIEQDTIEFKLQDYGFKKSSFRVGGRRPKLQTREETDTLASFNSGRGLQSRSARQNFGYGGRKMIKKSITLAMAEPNEVEEGTGEDDFVIEEPVIQEEEKQTQKAEETEKAYTNNTQYPSNLDLEDQLRLVVGIFNSANDAENVLKGVKKESSEAFITYIPKKKHYRVVYKSYDDPEKADSDFEEVVSKYPNAYVVVF